MQKKSSKDGMHKMPNGMMMKDSEMKMGKEKPKEKVKKGKGCK